MRAVRPPHLARLRRRVEALDAPAVQLWAWPGSGQQAVLDALVAEGGAVAQPLSVEDLAEESSLRRAVAGAVAGSAPWLVLPAVPAPPRGAARTVASLLPAGRRLLFAAPERESESVLATAYVGPREHLLTAAESAALWSEVTGRTPSPPLLAAIMAATDGWFRPLLLLAEAAAEGRGLEDGALAAIPAADSFLRHEVRAGLPPAERAVASRLALAGNADPELWDDLLDADQQAALDGLRDRWGLLVPAAHGGERLPAPLAALLAPEAWREPRAAELAAELAAAEGERGRPAAALRLLVGAVTEVPATDRRHGDGRVAQRVLGALDDLIETSWSELLSSAPLALLTAAAERLDAQPSPALDLVRGVIRGLDAPAPWRSSTNPAGDSGEGPGDLHRIARNAAAGEGGLAEAARLAAALLGIPAPDPPPADSPSAALPLSFAPLTRLVAALTEQPAVRVPAESDEAGDAGPADRREAPELAAALAAVAPPPAAEVPDLLRRDPFARAAGFQPDPVLGSRRPDRRLTAAAALAAAGLSRLARRRPALVAALRRRSDLAPVWRDRLETPVPEEPAGRSYELDLFGEGRVRRREGGAVRELSWPLKRALRVLAYLATSPGWRVLRSELEEELWPGADRANLRRNFHPTLSHLRRSLEKGLGEPWPSPLLLEGGFYRLNPELGWRIDASELERLATEGRRSVETERHPRAVRCWEAVRDLYRGALLAGWDDPWIAHRREHYQRLWLESIRGLGEGYLRLGRLDEAMDALRAVLIHDPLQERVHVALMEVYSLQGRRDLVHRQHDRLVDLLSRELGIDLADATKDAYQRLLMA